MQNDSDDKKQTVEVNVITGEQETNTNHGAEEIHIEKPKVPGLDYDKVQTVRKKDLLFRIRRLYYIQRWDVKEIAEKLKLSEKQVYNYIKKIKKFAKDVAEKEADYRADMLNFLWEVEANYKERIKKLWNQYNKTTNEKIQVDIIAEIRQNEKQHFELLQQIGIMPRQASHFTDKITYVSLLQKEQEKPKEEVNKKDENNNKIVVVDNNDTAH